MGGFSFSFGGGTGSGSKSIGALGSTGALGEQIPGQPKQSASSWVDLIDRLSGQGLEWYKTVAQKDLASDQIKAGQSPTIGLFGLGNGGVNSVGGLGSISPVALIGGAVVLLLLLVRR